MERGIYGRTTLEQHQQLRGKNPIYIWVLQIEDNHYKMVGIEQLLNDKKKKKGPHEDSYGIQNHTSTARVA